MSVYSRPSTDSKPFIPIDGSKESTPSAQPQSPEKEKLGAFFVFYDGADICDTRHLFGDAAVDAKILINTLEVLTGKGDAKMVGDVNRFRLQLLGSSQSRVDERDAESSLGEEDGEGYWLSSERTWRKHVKAILERERVAIVNGYIDDTVGESPDTEEGDVDFWDEGQAPELETPILEFGIGEQGWRGRSLSKRQSTAARGS